MTELIPNVLTNQKIGPGQNFHKNTFNVFLWKFCPGPEWDKMNCLFILFTREKRYLLAKHMRRVPKYPYITKILSILKF